jgi:hypothetical protein
MGTCKGLSDLFQELEHSAPNWLNCPSMNVTGLADAGADGQFERSIHLTWPAFAKLLQQTASTQAVEPAGRTSGNTRWPGVSNSRIRIMARGK